MVRIRANAYYTTMKGAHTSKIIVIGAFFCNMIYLPMDGETI